MRGLKRFTLMLMCAALAAGTMLIGSACHHAGGVSQKKFVNAKLVTVQSTAASPELTAGTYAIQSAPVDPAIRRYVTNALSTFGLTETADVGAALFLVDIGYGSRQATARGRMEVAFSFAIRKNDAAKLLLWRADGACTFHPKYDAAGFAPSVIACTLYAFNQPVAGMVKFNSVLPFYEKIIAL